MIKHSHKHEQLIIDFLENPDMDLKSIEKADYFLDNCKDCQEYANFYKELLNESKIIQENTELRDAFLKKLKKEHPDKYASYIQKLSRTDEGIEFIWEREVINNRLLEVCGIASDKPVKLSTKAKKDILLQLRILK